VSTTTPPFRSRTFFRISKGKRGGGRGGGGKKKKEGGRKGFSAIWLARYLFIASKKEGVRRKEGGKTANFLNFPSSRRRKKKKEKEGGGRGGVAGAERFLVLKPREKEKKGRGGRSPAGCSPDWVLPKKRRKGKGREGGRYPREGFG